MSLKLEETEAIDILGRKAAANWAMERAIVSLIYCAARLADEQRYLDWMDLFTTDGEYSAITRENLTHKGLRLFRDVGKTALHERAAFLMGLLQVPRGKTVHLVSNVEIHAGDTPNSASAASNFIIARTGDMEHSKLHAAGRYLDRFERHDDAWLFKERLVIVDSNVLPPEFTELL
jgi:3-phenylpropionate/cinnamic acid dioxygenase small subunit